MMGYTVIVSILLVMPSIHGGAGIGKSQPTLLFAEAIPIAHGDACKSKRKIIGKALKQFSSGDYIEDLHAKNTLLNIAHRSTKCRQAVVGMLMDSMDQPNLDFERQPANYYLWREGSELLGELKATEALDLLILHLDLNNGFHGSMDFQPAIVGVIRMADAAVPKLAVALQRSPKPGIRMAAADCLTQIGGIAAMNALKEARKGESSSCVANFIKVSLDTFTYQRKSGIAFDTRAPQADVDARWKVLMARECVE